MGEPKQDVAQLIANGCAEAMASQEEARELKPLAEACCEVCGVAIGCEQGQSFVGSTDGKVWHSGCYRRSPSPTPDELVEIADWLRERGRLAWAESLIALRAALDKKD